MEAFTDTLSIVCIKTGFKAILHTIGKFLIIVKKTLLIIDVMEINVMTRMKCIKANIYIW